MVSLSIIVQQETVDRAQESLRQYFKDMVAYYGKGFAIYKNHAVVHLPDDVRQHQVAMDAMSAYPFENMQKLFINVSVMPSIRLCA